MTDEKTFTVSELAERWGCDPKTVYLAINEKRLDAFRIGKRTLRVSIEAVKRFEKARAA